MYSEWLIVLLCAYMAFICGVMAYYGVCMAYYGGVYRGLYGHGLRDRRVGVACVVGCVYGVYPLGCTV